MFKRVIFFFLLVMVQAILYGQKVDTLLEGLLRRKENFKALVYAKNKEKNLVPAANSWESMYITSRLSTILFRQGKYKEAESYAKKALANPAHKKDSTMWAEAILNLASAYQVKLYNDTVKILIDQVSNYAERSKDQELNHSCYSLKGNLLMGLQRAKEALPFYEKALALTREHSYYWFLSKDLLSLATAYLHTEPQKCMPLLNEAEKVSVQQKDTALIAMVFAGRAVYYLANQQIDAWRLNNAKSLEYALSVKHAPTAMYSYVQLLDFHKRNGEFQEAYQVGIESIRFAQRESIHTFDLYLFQKMFEICKTLDKKGEAIQYLEKYVEAKTNMIQTDLDVTVNMLKLQHELQENKLRLSNQELALSNAQKRNLLLLLINGLMLCIGVAYYLNRRTRKQHIHYLYTKEKLVEQWIAEERSLRQDGFTDQVAAVTEESAIPSDSTDEEDEKNIDASLFKDLILIIEQKKLYLDPELNLKNVISILRTNRTYLNKAIQSSGDGNFKQIINRYRVEEAKRLLEKYVQDNSNENIEQFYIMAGFNSISSYYRVFRNITGLTPKEYIQEYARDIRK